MATTADVVTSPSSISHATPRSQPTKTVSYDPGSLPSKSHSPCTGRRIIKLHYRSEVRRIKVDSFISYAELCKTTREMLPDIRRAHRTVYYLWEDIQGDTITASTEDELEDALISLWGDQEGSIIPFNVSITAPSDTKHPDDCGSLDGDDESSSEEEDDDEPLIIEVSCKKLTDTILEESTTAGKDNMLQALGIRKYAKTQGKLGRCISFIGVFLSSVYVALFLYFLDSNFYQLYQSQTFMSLDPEAGNCIAVGRIWSLPDILLDQDGNWYVLLVSNVLTVDYPPTDRPFRFGL
jgi:PB1 domain